MEGWIVAVRALATAVSIGMLVWLFLTLIAERIEEGERKVKASRERQARDGRMPEIQLPDDWEPPPMLPGDDDPGMY